ncbi:MAG: LAGLIDADG family homing endonuclease [Candidatus Nanoarchaeia archaeon]
MRFDLSKVSYSKKDLKENVKIPKKLDKDLAYFLGIHYGDGTLGFYKRYYYYIGYSGHLNDEYIFYTLYFKRLFKKLFNKNLRIFEDLRENKESIKLNTQSKAIFTFLNKVIGVKYGPKINVKVPKVLKNSRYLSYFIRGIADTDFSISFKNKDSYKHSYPVISFCTKDKLLVKELNILLKKFGFNTFVLYDYPKKRYKKVYISNLLQINGKEQLQKWMDLIGFNSPKHLTKYEIWKKYGFCPPHTTLNERIKILKEGINNS